MGWHQINPLRSARGGFAGSAATNHGAIALFNNDGTRLLKVWSVSSFFNSGTQFIFSVTRTRLANQNAGLVTPVVTDEGIPPGQIDWDDLAVIPPSDYACVNTGANIGAILSVAPLAVLR